MCTSLLINILELNSFRLGGENAECMTTDKIAKKRKYSSFEQRRSIQDKTKQRQIFQNIAISKGPGTPYLKHQFKHLSKSLGNPDCRKSGKALMLMASRDSCKHQL